MLTKIPAGTMILKENEVNMDMYKIINGSVEIYKGYGTENESILGILSKGSYFGEIGLFAQKPAIYTAIAYDDIVVQRITMAEIDDYIVNNQHDIFAIMQNMAESMYNTNYAMSMVLDDMAHEEKVNHALQKTTFYSNQFAKYNLKNSIAFKNQYNTRI